MYGRFVGLDISGNYINISLIKRGLRDIQLLQTIRKEISPGSQDGLSSLSEIFSEYSLPKSDIATSLSGDPISVRVIKFPFSDPKKIDQVYGYELESLSTYDPSEKAHSYQLVKKENGADALVCVYEKNQIQDALESYNKVGLDPKVLTYSPVALGVLKDDLEGPRPLLLVNIDDNGISFCLFDANGAIRVRSALKPVTTFHKNLNDKEIEFSNLSKTLKHISTEESGQIIDCMSPLVSEIKKTIQFFEIELKERIKTVQLSGEISLVPNICEKFTDELKRDVKKIYIPELGRDNSPIFAKSYALSLYGAQSRSGYLNYRKNEFKYEGTDRELRKLILTPAILFSILFIMLIYSYTSEYYELKDRAEGLEAQVSSMVKQTFPDVKVIHKPKQFMESEVSKIREKLSLLQGVEGGSTPLDVLKDISSSLPASIKLTVNQIKFESGNRVRIEGICDSYQEVAEIEQALTKSGLFESVTRDNTGNAMHGKTKFEISVVIKSNV